MKRKQLKYSTLFIVIFILASLLLTACGGVAQPKTYTVGVINYISTLDPILEACNCYMDWGNDLCELCTFPFTNSD